METVTHSNYLRLAIPFTIATVTQPLLGAVDTAVVGRLESPTFIGGVAIGTVIFNSLYWLFGFLRVSTSGFAAQSLGSDCRDELYYTYFRPAAIALLIGLLFLFGQYIILDTAMLLYKADPEVSRHATTYFTILVWGAPLVLVSYVNLGWLMGRKHVRESIFLQISTNLLNIFLDIFFVLILKLEVAGVAWATLISQCYCFLLGLFLISRKIEITRIRYYLGGLFEWLAIKKMIGVNVDLLIRTACLLIMTNMFIAKGSVFGTSVLAANAVLLQILYIVAYCFDGLANAGSVFAGKAVGEKKLHDFNRTVQISNIHVALLTLVWTLVLLLLSDQIPQCFTNLETVLSLCSQYMIWIIISPSIIGIGLVYYGFYTGATYTGPVRNSLLLALLVFILSYYSFTPIWQNHGLWLSFILFSLVRTGVLLYYKKGLIEGLFTLPSQLMGVKG